MPGQYPPKSKSWLARNWKLLLGLVIGLMVLGIAAVLSIVAFVMSLLKGSDVAKDALAKAQSNPAVVQRLGTPIVQGWLASGSINLNNGSGDANLALPISGPKGKGTLHVIAHKTAGKWIYTLMQVNVEGSAENIDLLPPTSVVQDLNLPSSFVYG
jgi:hypothetical protein